MKYSVILDNDYAYQYVFKKIENALLDRICEKVGIGKSKAEAIVRHYCVELKEKQESERKEAEKDNASASRYLLERLILTFANRDRYPNTIKSYFNLDKRNELFSNAKFQKALLNYDLQKIHKKYNRDNYTELAEKLRKITDKKISKNISIEKQSFLGQLSLSIIDFAEFICATDNNEPAKKYLSLLQSEIEVSDNQCRRQNITSLLDNLQNSVTGIGPALRYDFLKDMGFSIGKPDRHIINLIERLDIHLYYSWGKTLEERVVTLLDRIAKANSISAYAVDKVFWLYMSGNLFDHKDKELGVISEEELEKLLSSK